MIDETIVWIKKDPILYNYLKYHSYWYLIIKRDGSKVKDMIEEMKKEFKITKEDRLKDLSEKIQMVSSLLDVLS